MCADVTVLGLGPMGAALAAAFLAAGHRTTVWNRTPGKADALAAQGAAEAVEAAAAVTASPLTVVCLAAYDAVHEVLAPWPANSPDAPSSTSPPAPRSTHGRRPPGPGGTVSATSTA